MHDRRGTRGTFDYVRSVRFYTDEILVERSLSDAESTADVNREKNDAR